MTSFSNRLLAAAALSTVTLMSSGAFARPANIVGTYLLRSDNNQIKLVITAQINTGVCQRILGSASDYFGGFSIGMMSGWYCPATGRIGYQVLKPSDASTLQSFTGTVSTNGSIFGGTVSVFGPGLRGEYNLLGGPL